MYRNLFFDTAVLAQRQDQLEAFTLCGRGRFARSIFWHEAFTDAESGIHAHFHDLRYAVCCGCDLSEAKFGNERKADDEDALVYVFYFRPAGRRI